MSSIADIETAANGRDATQVFAIDPKVVRTSLWSGVFTIVVFGSLFVLSVVLLGMGEITAVESLGYAAFFGFFLLMGAYMVHFSLVTAPRSAVYLNDEGLWLSGSPEEHAFVRWDDVRRIRERPILQRLELLDERGESRLRVEYQIEEFEKFAPELMARTRPYRDLIPLHTTHRMRKVVHGFWAIALCLSITAWIWFGEGTLRSDWFFCLLAAGALYYLLRTPIRLRITPDALETQLFIRTFRDERDDIHSFEFQCEMASHQRNFIIEPVQKGRPSGVVIGGLQTSILEVYEALEEWLAQDPGTEEGV